MGSVWFEWKLLEYHVLITQAKDNRVIKPAAWWDDNVETKDIIGYKDEKSGGTCFGCSKQGRVAFLVNVTPSSKPGAELLTVKFLKGKMTPQEFAKELDTDKNLSLGLTFYLVVADVHLKSFVYISKKYANKEIDVIREVPRGFYYIDSTGMTEPSSNLGEHLRQEFLGKLKSSGQVKVPKGEGECDIIYNGSTTLEVMVNGKANFYEIGFENGQPSDHKFNFDID